MQTSKSMFTSMLGDAQMIIPPIGGLGGGLSVGARLEGRRRTRAQTGGGTQRRRAAKASAAS